MKDSPAKNPKPAKATGTLIYVVDDEPMLLELASVILEPLGHEIKTFRDPKAAVDAFAAARPHPSLIITDYAMHSMTGMDLIKACRALVPTQRILLVSGTVDENVYRDSSCKPDRFLGKPYQSRQLIDLVEGLLIK